MDTNAVNETVKAFTGSAAGAAGAWGLQDISYVGAIIASAFSITMSILGIMHIIKQWRKK